jgi:hypothetical protein
MQIKKLNQEFNVGAHNKIENVNDQSIMGALACLETFYYSFNSKDIDTFKKVWFHHELVQLNNPLGGTLRGIEPITDLYNTIFTGKASVWVKFTDIAYYTAPEVCVFAGTEIGAFSIDTETVPLSIRTQEFLAI